MVAGPGSFLSAHNYVKPSKKPKKRRLTEKAVEQRRRAGASWSQARRQAQAARMRLAHGLARAAEATPSPRD